MSSLSTMTVAQLAELSNAPVVHPTGQRKSKLTAMGEHSTGRWLAGLRQKRSGPLSMDRTSRTSRAISKRQGRTLMMTKMISSVMVSYAEYINPI